MIGQVLSGQLIKQLIQDLDCSISLNKGICLGSELSDMAIELEWFRTHQSVQFLLKINNLLRQCTSIEFTEVIMEIH